MSVFTIPAKTSNSEVLTDLERVLQSLPEGELRVGVQKVAEMLRSGQEVIIAGEHDEYTPAQAAKIVGVSRAHFRKILDQGAVPYRIVGVRDRRVKASDLAAYVRRTEELRAKTAWQAAHMDDLKAAALAEM